MRDASLQRDLIPTSVGRMPRVSALTAGDRHVNHEILVSMLGGAAAGLLTLGPGRAQRVEVYHIQASSPGWPAPMERHQRFFARDGGGMTRETLGAIRQRAPGARPLVVSRTVHARREQADRGKHFELLAARNRDRCLWSSVACVAVGRPLHRNIPTHLPRPTHLVMRPWYESLRCLAIAGHH